MQIFDKKQKFDLWMKITSIVLAALLSIAVAGLQLVEVYKEQIIASGIIKDDFAVGNLHANVYWSGFEFLVGLVLFLGVLFSILYFKEAKKQIIGVFVSTLIFVNLSMVVIVPRVEQYSQNAAIEFFKEISKEDCYTTTFGYKSYANYFYFNKQIPDNKNVFDRNWLLRGKTDKPVYVVCKNTKAAEFEKNYSDFNKIKEKNGFVFFKKNSN